MESTLSNCSLVIDTRDSFSSASASLEQSIRNFDNEKVIYEQTIDRLKNDLELIQGNFQKLNLQHHDMLAENKKLASIHEENGKNRLAVETMIAVVEKKQDILCSALERSEKVESSILERYEAHEDFVYCLKFRQNQLLKLVDNFKLKSNAMREDIRELQSNGGSLYEELTRANLLIKENSSTFIGEKSALIESHNNAIDELNNTLKSCTGEIQGEKALQETVKASVQDLQIKIDSTEKELHENKCILVEKDRASEEMKVLMTKELQQITLQEKEQLSAHAEEKAAILANSKESHEKLDKELEACKLECQNEKTVIESFGLSLQELQLKSESLEILLNEDKGLLDRKTKGFEEEKTALADEVKRIKIQIEEKVTAFAKEKTSWTTKHESLMMDLDNTKSAMGKMSESFKTEKEALVESHRQALESLTQESEHCKGELRALYQRYQHQKQAISKLAAGRK